MKKLPHNLHKENQKLRNIVDTIMEKWILNEKYITFDELRIMILENKKFRSTLSNKRLASILREMKCIKKSIYDNHRNVIRMELNANLNTK